MGLFSRNIDVKYLGHEIAVDASHGKGLGGLEDRPRPSNAQGVLSASSSNGGAQ